MANYRIFEGSLQDRFHHSRAKVQVFGGGYANGKTAAACIRALHLAKDYPGSNGLIARATFPKLNDTIRKEFLKWCPAHWIKSFPKSANASNTCTLQNGTTINFRYIEQQGKASGEATTSNLLSATYDWIIVDQMEDPEIVEKDFLDLLGRLRGMAPYVGEDDTMPETGPRWIILTINPTSNWVYKKLIRPLHDLNRGLFNPNLLCETDEDGKPTLDDNRRPIPIVELYEGATYENRDNLEDDFIKTLEATYRGQMRDRYLLGKWAAYEGLVYPDFDNDVHVVSHGLVEQFYWNLKRNHYEMAILEGFDYGMAVPSCYLLGFADTDGNVFLMDGFHQAEIPISTITANILDIREQYEVDSSNHILADPDIFRRKGGDKKVVGRSIADMFREDGIRCERGNNDIMNGIVKVSQYIAVQQHHEHPLFGTFASPRLYVSDKLEFFVDEIGAYRWKKSPSGDVLDKPIDKDDHAMDTVKYMMSNRPAIARLIRKGRIKEVGLRKWAESDMGSPVRSHRYG